jgi:endoglucanase
MALDPLSLLEKLIALPAPPGQEGAVRDFLQQTLDEMGIAHRTDVKGNLLVGSDSPKVVVTAHLDEIALMVTDFTGAGEACIAPLGGVKPYKWGEGPVEILSTDGSKTPGVLSFGGIHTEASQGAVGRDRAGQSVTWDDARVRFFVDEPEVGDRVVLAAERRKLVRLGGHKIAGPFLDDRADLVAWLLMRERLSELPDTLFVATVSEETGGEGALWVLGQHRPDLCLALELAPIVPDAPVSLSPEPVVWVRDGYANLDAKTLKRVRDACPGVQSAAYSRGGSDASIGQSLGLCATGITLGFPCENSHGFEIMDERALTRLADAALTIVKNLRGDAA